MSQFRKIFKQCKPWTFFFFFFVLIRTSDTQKGAYHRLCMTALQGNQKGQQQKEKHNK